MASTRFSQRSHDRPFWIHDVSRQGPGAPPVRRQAVTRVLLKPVRLIAGEATRDEFLAMVDGRTEALITRLDRLSDASPVSWRVVATVGGAIMLFASLAEAVRWIGDALHLGDVAMALGGVTELLTLGL